VTATITSALTVTLSNNYVKYDKLSDFNGKTIAAVTGTLPFAHAVATGLHVIPAQSRDEAMQLLLTKKVVGVADYRSTADYYLQKHQLSNQLILADAFISQNSFAFALPINSPLMHPINVELRNLQANGYVRFLCRNRLGPQDVRNCEI
jgi:ABC-type amino acid transport substrate-binding protein